MGQIGVILVAEDDASDVIHFRSVMCQAGVEMAILTLDSAGAVSDYLRGRKEFADRTCFPMPDLIFISAELRENMSIPLLRWLVQTPSSSKIPTVLLTKRSEEKVRLEALRHGAWECFPKPFGAHHWQQLKCLLAGKGSSAAFPSN